MTKHKPAKTRRREFTHNDDFFPAWIVRGLMVIGITIGGWFLNGVDTNLRRMIERVIAIEGKVDMGVQDIRRMERAQDESKKEFNRFEREQGRKFDKIEEELKNKMDRRK